MTKLTLEQIKDMLQSMVLKDVAEAAGVEYTSLTRFVNGKLKDPGYALVSKVGQYLEEKFVIRAE